MKQGDAIRSKSWSSPAETLKWVFKGPRSLFNVVLYPSPGMGSPSSSVIGFLLITSTNPASVPSHSPFSGSQGPVLIRVENSFMKCMDMRAMSSGVSLRRVQHAYTEMSSRSWVMFVVALKCEDHFDVVKLVLEFGFIRGGCRVLGSRDPCRRGGIHRREGFLSRWGIARPCSTVVGGC